MQPAYTVGILTASTEGKYYGDMIAGIHQFLHQYNCGMLILQTPDLTRDSGQGGASGWQEHLAWDLVDGWIVIHMAVDDDYIQSLLDAGKEVVMLHKRDRSFDCHVVDFDSTAGSEQAVNHLIASGHTRIAFVGALHRSSIKKRFAGYLNALQKAGIAHDPDLVYTVEDNLYVSAHNTALRLEGQSLPFTAVFAATDRNARGWIDGLQQIGIRVPEDIAVVGFDNLELAANSNPPLATVDTPTRSVGYKGAELLYRRLTGAEPEKRSLRLLPTRFIPRWSCGVKSDDAVKQDELPKQITPYATQKYYEEVLINNNEIAMYLIHNGFNDDNPLAWLRWTNFSWACLGLWADDDKKTLDIIAVYDPLQRFDPLERRSWPAELFPPTGQIRQMEADKELFRIHPVRTATKDWGVLVLLGTVDNTSFVFGESVYKHWAGLLGLALERKDAEERIRYLAYHDPVTGLPNRTWLYNNLAGIEKAAVMVLDLDNFKVVNDTLGHQLGDRLLGQVAARLVEAAGEAAKVARLGGDEFVIVYNGPNDKKAITAVADRLLRDLAQPFEIDGHELFVSASMGISRYPDDGAEADALIRRADLAMYRAKYLGKNKAELYAVGMAGPYHERLYVENNLRKAIESGELELYYQAQVDMQSGHVLGVEALMRWNSPERGLVPPGEFIPLAEETGLIVPMGKWLLRQAARQLDEWHRMGFSTLCMAVNISAREFQQPDFVRNVMETLNSMKIDPGLFCLEITESTAIADLAFSREQLKKLIAYGLQIAIDDFGTGFSSLSLLKQLPINMIKIDRSFIADLTRSEDDYSIVRAIIAMSHSLKLKVIAEGVETQQQVEWLQQLRCDYAQGYYWSRPLTADQMTRMLLGAGVT